MRISIALLLAATLLTACEYETIRYVQHCPKRLYMPQCMKDGLMAAPLCPEADVYLQNLTVQQERLPQ